MESPANSIESLVARFEIYVKTTFELSKLKMVEMLVNLTTSLISRVMVICTIAIFFLILSIGIALWLGEMLGKSYYGFFILSAFYLLAGILFQVLFSKQIKKIISTSIINQALQKNG
jgi:hypothetical protein